MEDGGALVVSAHQRKNRDAKGLRLLSLFSVSSGDVCGKKTNPCGEDAVCNQTNVHGICQCRAGFQRSQESGQCEGDASTSVLGTLSFPSIAHVSLSVLSAKFKEQREFVAIKLARVDIMFSCQLALNEVFNPATGCQVSSLLMEFC